MKKNRTTRLVVLVLFLAIVTAVIISGTFAKYTTTVDGEGSAVVAKWAFAVTGWNDASTSKVALTDLTLNDKVADGKIAPGTDGSFAIEIDATGAEVSVDYAVTISNLSANMPKNLKFYTDAAFANELTADLNGVYTAPAGTVTLAEIEAGNAKETVNLYWKWEYVTDATTDADSNGILDSDEQDTVDGEAAATMTFDVTVVGTQADPRS